MDVERAQECGVSLSLVDLSDSASCERERLSYEYGPLRKIVWLGAKYEFVSMCDRGVFVQSFEGVVRCQPLASLHSSQEVHTKLQIVCILHSPSLFIIYLTIHYLPTHSLLIQNVTHDSLSRLIQFISFHTIQKYLPHLLSHV